MKDLLLLSNELKKRGFEVKICKNIEQALELITKMLDNGSNINSIGFGNSVTLKSLGLYDNLSKYTHNIYIHKPAGTEDADRKALTSDFYFTSANAVSLDGHIVNIDGTGNRTAATCFGPKHLVYVIGKNKITNTLEEAILRAKLAAIEVARMYNRKAPCVVTGKCEDCLSPECICAVMTIHRRKPFGIDITVILINEDLGL